MGTPRIVGRARVLAAVLGAGIGVGVALTLEPFGIYLWEQHPVRIASGAVLGAGLAQAALSGLTASRRWVRWGTVALSLAAVHSAGIAVMFAWAVDRAVVVVGLAFGVALATMVRSAGAPAALLALLAPVLLVCNLAHARFLRSPGVDCAALAATPGVTGLSVWPDGGDPRLARSVVYDVVGDESAGIVLSAHVRQAGRWPGCGALGVWSLDGGGTAHEGGFVQTDGVPCWMTARVVLDRRTQTAWAGLASYDPTLEPMVSTWRYGAGPTLEGLRWAASPVDPSDYLLRDDAFVMLAYPRRFGGEGASQLARVAPDPEAPEALATARFEPNGWMTEYLADGGDVLYVSDVFGHLYEVDARSLAVLRKVRPGASMLGIAVDEDVLYIAAPYERRILVVDRATLSVVRRLPAGAAVRDLAFDRGRGVLYATSYGDGTVWRYDLDGGEFGPLSPVFGTPLRGLDVLPKSGAVLVGGGCGVFHLDPDAVAS